LRSRTGGVVARMVGVATVETRVTGVTRVGAGAVEAEAATANIGARRAEVGAVKSDAGAGMAEAGVGAVVSFPVSSIPPGFLLAHVRIL
jgi:hypothetical protein